MIGRSLNTLSVVIPLFNEAETIRIILPEIYEQCSVLGLKELEFIAVDDGSSDDTLSILSEFQRKHAELNVVSFTRNFGKEAAIHAGLIHASGDAVVVMDGDGQHPVSLLPNMVNLWVAGAEVVAACKSDRGDEGVVSRLLAAGFYWLFRVLTNLDIKGLSDYMLLDRTVVDTYCKLPERKRFFRGLITWMGLSTSKVYFDVPRRVGGASSWSRVRLLRLGTIAISAFTSSPLHLVSVGALLYLALSAIIGGIALFDKFMGNAVTGFTTVIILILITGMLILFGLGQLGLYIEQIYEEMKGRPDYLINDSKSTIRSKVRGK